MGIQECRVVQLSSGEVRVEKWNLAPSPGGQAIYAGGGIVRVRDCESPLSQPPISCKQVLSVPALSTRSTGLF